MIYIYVPDSGVGAVALVILGGKSTGKSRSLLQGRRHGRLDSVGGTAGKKRQHC